MFISSICFIVDYSMYYELTFISDVLFKILAYILIHVMIS